MKYIEYLNNPEELSDEVIEKFIGELRKNDDTLKAFFAEVIDAAARDAHLDDTNDLSDILMKLYTEILRKLFDRRDGAVDFLMDLLNRDCTMLVRVK